jgi:type VI secretion system protein ImpL
VRAGGAKKAAKAAFAAPGGPADLCAEAVRNKYPFTRGALQEIPILDFAKLFAPDGELDAFFKAQIAPFVDTSRGTWRPQTVNGVPAPISQSDIDAFERASNIGKLFFGSGGATPAVHFTIKPEFLDTGAKQVTLTLGATDITYAHGPLHQTALVWPGDQGMDSVRLSFDPPGEVIEAQGPWALFRLFDKGALTRGASPELYDLSFTAGPRQATFSIRAGSVLNPFAPGVLQGFRCPSME